MTRHTDSVEVVVKGQRRRRCSLAEKAALPLGDADLRQVGPQHILNSITNVWCERTGFNETMGKLRQPLVGQCIKGSIHVISFGASLMRKGQTDALAKLWYEVVWPPYPSFRRQLAVTAIATLDSSYPSVLQAPPPAYGPEDGTATTPSPRVSWGVRALSNRQCSLKVGHLSHWWPLAHGDAAIIPVYGRS